MKSLKPEFKVNDVVTFCAYPDQLKQDLKCKILKIEIDHKKGYVLYHLSGDALSITSGGCIKESELFKPWRAAFTVVNDYNLEFNLFKSEYLTENCYSMKFRNTNKELLIRFDSSLVELFEENGQLLASSKF